MTVKVTDFMLLWKSLLFLSPLLFSEIRLDRWRRLGGQALELTDLATVESAKARSAIKSVRRVCTQLESSISLDAPNTLDTLR